MSNRDSGEVMMAFVLGGLIGAILGVLYAPRSGKDTRNKLKEFSEDMADKFDDLRDDVKDKTKNIIEESKEIVKEHRGRIEEAIEAGKKAYEKV